MSVRVERLPYGIGRFTPTSIVSILVLLAVTVLGLYAYYLQLTEGEIVTGMRDVGTMGGATWGLYIAFVIYFVGVSFTGITVAALMRLLNLEALKPISRVAELLTVVSLILAAFSVLVDLGQPLRGIVNLFLYARPQSPFFGTFTLVVSGYLFASVVYLYLDGRRDAALCVDTAEGSLKKFYRLWAAGYRDTPAERLRHTRATFWLAIAIVPLLVTAHSTLGLVFGLQVGRPGWFSALQAPAFVIMAGVSGVGLLIVIAAVLRRAMAAQDELGLNTFTWLGNFLMVLTAAYLYFVVVDLLTTSYAGPTREVRANLAVLLGNYAWIYWLSVASLAIPFLLLFAQFVLRRYSLAVIVLSGALVQVAAVGKRVLVVVPSQTSGMLLPYSTGSYSPTWVEYLVILGLLALGTLLYIFFMKVFPIMEVAESTAAHAAHPTEPGPPPGGRSWQRAYLAIAMVIVGFGLQAVSYFYLAAPWGFPPSDPSYSNPRAFLGLATFPAATSFILGVVIVFLAAVVYELLPEPTNA